MKKFAEFLILLGVVVTLLWVGANLAFPAEIGRSLYKDGQKMAIRMFVADPYQPEKEIAL